jgi:hypothetical protein
MVRFTGSLLLIVALTGCGGGNGTITPPPTHNPSPVLTSISPTGATAGGAGFTLTVNGSSFISGSVVKWGGSNRTTTYVRSTQLTAAISASDIASAGTVQVTVFNPTPGGGTSSALTFTINAAETMVITTTQLPASASGKPYNFTLGSVGGAAPITWSLAAGSLPTDLMLDATGRISGTISGGTSSFTVQATDATVPTPNVQTRDLTLQVLSSLGRNDTCTAGTTAGTTVISNGRIRASISPYGDLDVYSFHGTAGAHVTIETFAQRLDLDGDSSTQDSYLDSMLELLDSSCQPIAVSDDISYATITDSKISVSSTPVPSPPCPPGGYTPCADITPPTSLPYTGIYFIRVRDFRSDGRPDLIYELSLSGAN